MVCLDSICWHKCTIPNKILKYEANQMYFMMVTVTRVFHARNRICLTSAAKRLWFWNTARFIFNESLTIAAMMRPVRVCTCNLAYIINGNVQLTICSIKFPSSCIFYRVELEWVSVVNAGREFGLRREFHFVFTQYALLTALPFWNIVKI